VHIVTEQQQKDTNLKVVNGEKDNNSFFLKKLFGN
jgi:hypothetical protein